MESSDGESAYISTASGIPTPLTMPFPIINAKQNPCNEDVDHSIKTNGIRGTFEGITAEHGYCDLREVNGVYVTETVGFGFYFIGQATFLVVVSRSDTDAVYVFRADDRDRRYAYVQQHDQTVCRWANLVRKAIAKCPKGPTQEEIAQTVSTTVNGSIDGIRAEMKTHTETIRHRVNNHALWLFVVFVLAIGGVGLILYVLRECSNAFRYVDGRVSEMDGKVSQVIRDQAILTNTSVRHDDMIELLNKRNNAVEATVREHGETISRQGRQLDQLSDDVEVLKAMQESNQKQRAIEGSSDKSTQKQRVVEKAADNNNNQLTISAPHADSIFNILQSLTAGLANLMGFCAVAVIVMYAVVKCADACDAACQKKKKKQ